VRPSFASVNKRLTRESRLKLTSYFATRVQYIENCNTIQNAINFSPLYSRLRSKWSTIVPLSRFSVFTGGSTMVKIKHVCIGVALLL
jgi:hypothetical protein